MSWLDNFKLKKDIGPRDLALMRMGATMMANNRQGFGPALGSGINAGLDEYSRGMEQADQARHRKALEDLKQRGLDITAAGVASDESHRQNQLKQQRELAIKRLTQEATLHGKSMTHEQDMQTGRQVHDYDMQMGRQMYDDDTRSDERRHQWRVQRHQDRTQSQQAFYKRIHDYDLQAHRARLDYQLNETKRLEDRARAGLYGAQSEQIRLSVEQLRQALEAGEKESTVAEKADSLEDSKSLLFDARRRQSDAIRQATTKALHNPVMGMIGPELMRIFEMFPTEGDDLYKQWYGKE